MDKKVEMTVRAVNAAMHCLSNVEVKGRAAIRKHKKIQLAIRECCTDGDSIKQPVSHLVLDEEVMDYFADMVDKAIEEGFEVVLQGAKTKVNIQGVFGEGYDDLATALDNQEKCENEVEKEKSKVA